MRARRGARLPRRKLLFLAIGLVSGSAPVLASFAQPMASVRVLDLVCWAGLVGSLAGLWTVARDTWWRIDTITNRLTLILAGGEPPLAPVARADGLEELARAVETTALAASENQILSDYIDTIYEESLDRYESIMVGVRHFTDTADVIVDALRFSGESMHNFATDMFNAAGGTQQKAKDTALAAGDTSTQLGQLAEGVEALSRSIHDIAGRVVTAATQTQGAVARMDSTELAVQSLVEAVGRIDTITGLIRSVAQRTNLLALNATIEAARAGEAGRGFAVVAGEVKTLAAQTARATEDISRQILAIQASTAGTVEAIREVGAITREVDLTARAIAEEVEGQGAISREIAGQVQAVSTITATTAEAVIELTDATEQALMSSSVTLEAALEIGRQVDALAAHVAGVVKAVRLESFKRRRHDRFSLPHLSARVLLGGQDLTGPIDDISHSGMLLGITVTASRGAMLEVFLPGETEALEGRVVRAAPHKLALMFRKNKQTLARVEAWMAAHAPEARAA